MPDLRRRFGGTGYEKAKREFTIESVNRRILEEVFGFDNVRIPRVMVESQNGETIVTVE